ncbi:hypothetical protein GALL_245470 [mine drainage metagenome]|uniref:Uncharacterized protein n=1 Tax=mine drainage metagenome TaxID=410659 RepID=A0A1J5RDQ8_9ZZZZ
MIGVSICGSLCDPRGFDCFAPIVAVLGRFQHSRFLTFVADDLSLNSHSLRQSQRGSDNNVITPQVTVVPECADEPDYVRQVVEGRVLLDELNEISLPLLREVSMGSI